MRQLGEMVVEGRAGFGSFAHRAILRGAVCGLLSGWNYWVMFRCFGRDGGAVDAAGIYMQYWLPDVPNMGMGGGVFIIINAVNLVNVRLYGEQILVRAD